MSNKCVCGNIANVIGPGGQEICRSCDHLIAKREWDEPTLQIVFAAGLKVFRFHFLDRSKTEDGIGKDVADAFRNLGYGGGAIRAVDYYEEIVEKGRV